MSSDLDFLKDMVAFPDAGEIADHAVAFAQMMFTHTALEREIADLQDAITNEPAFGEQRANQYGTRERPKEMKKLIEAHRGKDLPQTDAIAKLLTDAIDPCEQRNMLAHGTWWGFHRPTATIIVRSGTRWEHPDIPPEQRQYTASDIRAVSDRFEDIAAGLYKLRGSIKLMTPKQADILDEIAAWASKYPCIKAMHVYGSIARDEATALSDIDIAFEYVADLHSESGGVECYTKANADWDALAARLKDRFGHQPRCTGLSPYAAPYDHKAWAAIRAGRKIGRRGKVLLTWTAPKPSADL